MIVRGVHLVMCFVYLYLCVFVLLLYLVLACSGVAGWILSRAFDMWCWVASCMSGGVSVICWWLELVGNKSCHCV